MALASRSIMLLAMAAFVSAATLRALDPLVPAIAGEYRTTAGMVGLTITAFTLAYGLCQLFWGPVGDRFGKYRNGMDGPRFRHHRARREDHDHRETVRGGDYDHRP
jgi:MFS family permease